MPNLPYLYADEFIEVLKKKHAAGTYKEMVTISIDYCIHILTVVTVNLQITEEDEVKRDIYNTIVV